MRKTPYFASKQNKVRKRFKENRHKTIYKNRFKDGLQTPLQTIKPIPNRVKLSFLSPALVPHEIVQISQVYEGFKPSFGST